MQQFRWEHWPRGESVIGWRLRWVRCWLKGIELYAGPPALGGPDDLNAVIRGFIDGAKQSVLVAVQELDSRPVAEAIWPSTASSPNSPDPSEPGPRSQALDTWPSSSTRRTRITHPSSRADTASTTSGRRSPTVTPEGRRTWWLTEHVGTMM
jgi:hypothetical protein